MEGLRWFSENWFTLLQSVGIIGGLIFTAAALKLDAKTRRITNLIEITKGHREIWAEFYARPDLARIFDTSAGQQAITATAEQELFIRLLILHLNSAYHAMEAGVYLKPNGLQTDVQQFFSLPVARSVWEKIKSLQDPAFVLFVESARRQR